MPSGAPPESRPSQTQLTITVAPDGRMVSNTYSLDCRGSGTGTLPGAAAACTKLAKLGAAAFAPVATGTACTEIYGGPQVATVKGTLNGEPVDARFSRSNGCEIDRWQRLDFLFPVSLNWAH